MESSTAGVKEPPEPKAFGPDLVVLQNLQRQKVQDMARQMGLRLQATVPPPPPRAGVHCVYCGAIVPSEMDIKTCKFCIRCGKQHPEGVLELAIKEADAAKARMPPREEAVDRRAPKLVWADEDDSEYARGPQREDGSNRRVLEFAISSVTASVKVSQGERKRLAKMVKSWQAESATAFKHCSPLSEDDAAETRTPPSEHGPNRGMPEFTTTAVKLQMPASDDGAAETRTPLSEDGGATIQTLLSEDGAARAPTPSGEEGACALALRKEVEALKSERTRLFACAVARQLQSLLQDGESDEECKSPDSFD